MYLIPPVVLRLIPDQHQLPGKSRLSGGGGGGPFAMITIFGWRNTANYNNLEEQVREHFNRDLQERLCQT